VIFCFATLWYQRPSKQGGFDAKKKKTEAAKKQPKEKPKGEWILPDDGLHEALAQIPLKDILKAFPPGKP
jgi:hypothetical protein